MLKKSLIYNANANLKAVGVSVPFTEEQIIEYIKCRDDPLYFISNYAKIVSLDEGIVNMRPYPYQERAIDKIHNNSNVILKLGRQLGKALPLDTLIATESGQKPISDIRVGDRVFGPDGQLCNVTGISPDQLVKMYKITFDNGDTITSCEDHLWTVCDKNSNEITKTTKQLFNSQWRVKYCTGRHDFNYQYNYYIPTTKPIQYSTKNLDVDPYICGSLLGELINCTSSHQRIPVDYLQGDIDQRIALLQGLMDVGGYISSSGICQIQITTSNQNLSSDTHQLMCSLGLKVRVVNYSKKHNRYSFTCPRSLFDVFRVPHKLARQQFNIKRSNDHYNKRIIQNIELLREKKFGKCIAVDNISKQYLCGKQFIPTHNSSIVAAYFAWYVTFNSNKTVAILGNKQAIAIEIFSRVQFIIEQLPQWLQQGVVKWNVKSLELENGSTCFASASSASAVRGQSINMILLDEFAHLKPNLAEEFIASVFPTISSSQTSKLIIVSTPNGLNHYHKMWVEAENGVNNFTPISGHWTEHPDRDQEWADQQRKMLGEVRYLQEVECQFSGSSYTLVDGVKIASLPIEVPIIEKDDLEIFFKPAANRSYVITVDTSRGRHLDYSAFSVIDITEMPYRVVATYKNNQISPLEFPHLIVNTARQYNNAFLLIEINDLGEQVSNTIWYEYEYEYVYFTAGNTLSQLRGYPGIRTTTKVKSVGCSVLKELIEKDQLFVSSHKIIEELGVFVLHRKSYASQNPSINDDLCTTMWLFAWLTAQPIFQDITQNNLRQKLTEQKQQYINDRMTPFGFFINQNQHTEDSSSLLTKENPYYLTDDQVSLLSK